ncbi:MAG: LarC family nickel insertion protein [Clostridiales Family XIII bacterium]|jgi:uncharacterized protein (TIGR00299 family) protein|nr:LarC family nickel insertion protein [Clostridiales Family XIII bacterium]
MGKVLYFDCSAGISGDMTLGALVHLGADFEALKAELKKLKIAGYDIVKKKDAMSGIQGLNLDVLIFGEGDDGCDHVHASGGHDDRGTDHIHAAEHAHGSFREIRELIETSSLNAGVKKTAVDIFTVIAEAEAAVHDMPLEDVVFHEVGALDSIIDIVGAAICIDMLAPEEIMCSAVHDGHGSIECRHGIIPAPVPAVLEMLKGSEIRIVGEDVGTEMVTPTGLGILKGLKAKCALLPEMNVTGVGYGFGKRDTGRFRALRVIMGTR